MSMAIINLHLPVELLTILLSAVARLRSLRSDGHCMFASDASGNGVAEMYHRSVKRIATMKHCTIAEAVYWYNVAPKDDVDPV